VEYLRHVLSSEEVSKTLKKTMTELLKKNRFNWNKDAQIAFGKLKIALCKALVLKLPDCKKTFALEINACATRIMALLIQEGN
jgi:hypothetical protein